MIAVIIAGLVYLILRFIYYFRKYSGPADDAHKIRVFILTFLPDFYVFSNEDFYSGIKLVAIILFVIAIIYMVFFKIPVPFLGKPFLVFSW